jgi:hypothetical protein
MTSRVTQFLDISIKKDSNETLESRTMDRGVVHTHRAPESSQAFPEKAWSASDSRTGACLAPD